MLLRIQLAMLSVFVFGATVLPQQKNPLIGTWKSNPTKTKIYLGPPTSSNVSTIEASGFNGIKYISKRTNSRGETNIMAYSVNFDGKTYPYTQGGGTARDGVAIDQINSHTYRLSYKLQGKTVQINYWIVASDGKSMSTVSSGLTAGGEVYSRIMVHDKQ